MNYEKENFSAQKSNGRVYTPTYIVNAILDAADYRNNKILKKHVMENSCGDGAFLSVIVRRYCEAGIAANKSCNVLKEELETYIHGIEISEVEQKKAVESVDNVAHEFGISGVHWDIQCADALLVQDYDGKMDFVLGNPPYVRVHNLGSSYSKIKSFFFAQNGMTDMYIVFFELGLRMLKENGTLGYITPSSYFSSVAGANMRQDFLNNNLLKKVIDLKHFQPFSATTYTTITVLQKGRKQKETSYYVFDGGKKTPVFIDDLLPEDFYIAGSFYFAKKKDLCELKKILSSENEQVFFQVKNGFATLADRFFIGHFDFSAFTIPIIKASTGVKYECLFPYVDSRLIPYEKISKIGPIREYYKMHEEELKKRSLENADDWHGFGRSQGINDVGKQKFAINALLRNVQDIKMTKCDAGVGVYSGLYILTDVSENEIRSILFTDDFISYISLLGKYKSGGYYTFSSKDLQVYLNYKYSQKVGIKNEQLSIFASA